MLAHLRFSFIFRLFCILILSIGCWGIFPVPAHSSTVQIERIPLTLEQLQDRLNTPVVRDGISMIDLQNFTIDLQPENAIFRDQFYRLLQAQLNRPKTRTGLNLSNSIIKGDFIISNLGLRIPLLGEALFSLFSAEELLQLNQSYQLKPLEVPAERNPLLVPEITVLRARIKLEKTTFLGTVDFSKTFFLNELNAKGANFREEVNASEARFSQTVNLNGSQFSKKIGFQKTVFYSNLDIKKGIFKNTLSFNDSEFQGKINFPTTEFEGLADFHSCLWITTPNFSESWWKGRVIFAKSQFLESVNFNQAIFEKSVDFRNTRFSQAVNLGEASLQELIDFSDVGFGQKAFLNLSDLKFESPQAQIVGDPGIIGRMIKVPSLEGNENLLRNLIQNFRQQERISDANKIESLRANLKLKRLREKLFSINLNTASVPRLVQVGFSSQQANAIVKVRTQQPFKSLTELLKLDEIDRETYLKVANRLILGGEEQSQGKIVNNWWDKFIIKSYLLPLWRSLKTGTDCLQLTILILLSGYGTRSELVFGVGIIVIAYFGFLFWFIDRWRKRVPTPILPTRSEMIWMFSSFTILITIGLTEIFSFSNQPLLTLLCLAIFLVPVPGVLISLLYKRGRYHNLMDVSYFTEDGSMRQLRLMIGKLPIMPRYPLARERHLPLLWNRGWNWLNYYDFSFNNLLKIGFNDLRLRDEHLPGLITALVWYQWGLGLLYLTLLLWTLSRTIPGLNLLIYLK